MGEVNCRIGKKEVEITHTLDVLKYWNSGKCNSAENRSSKGKSCKAINIWIFMKSIIGKSKWEISN